MNGVSKVGNSFNHIDNRFSIPNDINTRGQAKDKTLCEKICCCFCCCFPGEEEHLKPEPSPIRNVSLDSPQRRHSIPSVGLQKLSEKPLPHKSSDSNSGSSGSTTSILGSYMG